MERVKRHIILLLVGVAFVCFLSVKMNQPSNTKPIIKQTENIEVYLMAKQKIVVVPTSTSATTVEAKMMEIIQYMKQDSGAFTKLLNEATILEKVAVKEGCMTLSFASLKYERDNELQVLEALIYAGTQFADVDEIALKVDGEAITKMPVGNTLIHNTTRSFGINHVDSNQMYLHEGTTIPVYYEMKVDDTTYQVIQSTSIKDKRNYQEVLDTLLLTPPASSSLIQPLRKYQLRCTQDAVLKKGVLHLYFDGRILDKNKELNATIIRYLKLNWQAFDEIKRLKIYVNDKLMSDQGKNKISLH